MQNSVIQLASRTAVTNRNGEWLKGFLIENKLFYLNTFYQKWTGKKWKFMFPSSANAQIYFILINKKWVNCYVNHFHLSAQIIALSWQKLEVFVLTNWKGLIFLAMTGQNWEIKTLSNQFKIMLSSRHQSTQDESNDIKPIIPKFRKCMCICRWRIDSITTEN